MQTLNKIGLRYFLLSTLVVALCVQMGLVVWTLVRFTQIEHWRPGILFFEPESTQPSGLTRSAASHLQEGSWPHLLQVRRDGGIKVRQVIVGSPADRSGLRSGDVIVSVDGISLRTEPAAYFQIRLGSEPGDLLTLEWLRDGRMHTDDLTLDVTSEQVIYTTAVDQHELALGVGSMVWFQRGPFLIFPLVLLVMGTWMGFRSPHNVVAFRCSLFFLAAGLSTTPAFHPMISGWPDWVLIVSIFVVVIASFWEFILIFQILAVFPTSTAFGSWLHRRTLFVWIPLCIFTIGSLINVLSLTYGWDNVLSQVITGIFEHISVPVIPIFIVVVAASLLLAQQSVAHRQQRVRLQVLEIGFLLALVVGPLWIIAKPGSLLASWSFLQVEGSSLPVLVWLLDHIVYAGLKCALPLSFAYAILTQRIFGLRFVFGRSLRYLIDGQMVYLVLCFGLFIVLYEAISVWRMGMDVSDLLVASTAAGLILILIGGWAWARTPIMQFVNQHLFKRESENQRRLFNLRRSLMYFQDRDALLHKTGTELIESLDLSYAAIYLDSEKGASLAVHWYGVNERVRKVQNIDSKFFTEAGEPLISRLQSVKPDRPYIELYNQSTYDNRRASDFDLVVLLRGESGRKGCVALGEKLSEEPFSKDEIEQLLVLAAELELALENIEMADSLRHQARGLQRLSRRLIDVQESERRRLAQDLHDDTGQALTALKISLELTRNELAKTSDHSKERLTDAVALTDETLQRIRTIAHGLRPPIIDTIGLNAALEGLCQNFEHHTGISVVYSGVDTQGNSGTIDICLYRILQEGLTNSVKHGEATRIDVKLNMSDQALYLSIADNGKGFDTNSILTTQDDTGIGLIDMRERLESLHGHLEIQSQPGRGTRLVASVPLDAS